MLYISCDYKEDPKVPPTKFTITILGSRKALKVIKVANYPSLAHAYCEIGKAIKTFTGGTEALTSSSVDHLFMDGLLKEEDFVREYQTPEIKTYVRV